MNKRPEQTAQTRKKIMDVFITIAKRKGLNKTSISEVMKMTKLNRSTFYLYFTDINDFIMQIEKEILCDFCDKLEEYLRNLKKQDFENASQLLVDFILSYDDIIFLMLEEDSYFVSVVCDSARKIIIKLELFEDIPYRDYLIDGFLSSIIGVLIRWDKNGRKDPIDEISVLLKKVWISAFR